MINKYFKRYCFEITRKTLVQLESVLYETVVESGETDRVMIANLMCVKTVIRLIEGLQKSKNF